MSNSSVKNSVVELISGAEKMSGCLAFFGHWWNGMADNEYKIISSAASHNNLRLDFVDGGYFEYRFSVDITNPTEAELLEDALIIWQADALSVYCRSDRKHTAPDPNFYMKYKLLEGEIYYACSDLCDYLKPIANQPAFEIAWFVPSSMRKMYYRERGKVRKRE